MARILIVDDDSSFRESLGETVASFGHEVVAACDGDDALAALSSSLSSSPPPARSSAAIDLVFLDLRMPGLDGLAVLRAIRGDARFARIPVVLLTAHADADNTIEAMKLGAFDHLTKPIGRDDVASVLERALPPARDRHTRAGRDSKEEQATDGLAGADANADTDAAQMIGASPAMRDVQKLIGIAAASDATVLILGETGTGKELVARAMHAHGDRAARPFVAVNCAAIPADLLESELFGHERGAFSGAVQARAGRFREADGGTIFLDEIGDMTLAMQAKLLRVLQDRIVTPVGSSSAQRVDVRVLSATHRDLIAMVEDGRFREDLFYRLNVLRVALPPLRERGSDILALAERLIERYAAASSNPPKRLSSDAATALLEYGWPGNVRELENLMQKVCLVIRGDTIGRDDLQLPVPSTSGAIDDFLELDFASAIAGFEKMLLERALAESGNNRSAAARRLGMHRQLLYAKLKEHGLD